MGFERPEVYIILSLKGDKITKTTMPGLLPKPLKAPGSFPCFAGNPPQVGWGFICSSDERPPVGHFLPQLPLDRLRTLKSTSRIEGWSQEGH